MTHVEDAMLSLAHHGQMMHNVAVDVLGDEDLASNVSITTLILLHRDGPQRPTRIAEITSLTSGGATKLIMRLENAGLVAREAGVVPTDGRAIVVSLTEGGRAKVDRFVLAIGPYVEALVDALDEVRADA